MSVKSGRTWFTIALVLGGCAGANPFTAARFASRELENAAQGGGTSTQVANKINTTCDLTNANRKVIQAFGLRNRSKLSIQYTFTLMASAGSGGFVCDTDLPNYQRAGYKAVAIDPQSHTFTVGCDPVPLNKGTQLLALQITGQIAADNTGGANPILATAPLDGSVRIPVPELIVVGDSRTNFLCQGNDVCSQAGVIYIDIAGNFTNKATASRTQGTVCNTHVGNLPEWRLFDPNFADTQAGAFQYTAGSFIVVDVLDRANDSNPANDKVVWNVIDANGDVLHTASGP